MLQAERGTPGTLGDVIDRILDKGLVINADIGVAVAGVELLNIRIRAALASFETAAKFGLEFPSGCNVRSDAFQRAESEKEICPQCEKRVVSKELMGDGCPWCGWVSARAKRLKTPSGNGHREEEIPSVAAG